AGLGHAGYETPRHPPEPAPQRAHHAGRQRTLESERVADGDDQLPYPERRRVAELGEGEGRRVDADHSDVRSRVVPDQLGPQPAPVRESRIDTRGVVHNVAVRKDEAVGSKHESGAMAGKLPGGATPALDAVSDFYADHGRADLLGRAGHGAGVSVHELSVGLVAWRSVVIGIAGARVGEQSNCRVHIWGTRLGSRDVPP